MASCLQLRKEHCQGYFEINNTLKPHKYIIIIIINKSIHELRPPRDLQFTSIGSSPKSKQGHTSGNIRYYEEIQQSWNQYRIHVPTCLITPKTPVTHNQIKKNILILKAIISIIYTYIRFELHNNLEKLLCLKYMGCA